MGTFRRYSREEVSGLIVSSDCGIILGFKFCDYIILDEDCFVVNGRVIKPGLPVMDNAPYKIGGKLWALWDMRKNSPEWDSIDVFCGLIHEMMHCHQIELGIHKAGTFFTEGAALYAELLFKAGLRGICIDALLEEYGRFVCQGGNEALSPYYLGAMEILSRMEAGLFSWDEYFRTGRF